MFNRSIDSVIDSVRFAVRWLRNVLYVVADALDTLDLVLEAASSPAGTTFTLN